MRVLIVEDERELREAVARRVRALGHGVDEVGDGEAADEQLAVFDYGVVVLDRMLPDGDAVERLRGWRTRGVATPVLLLTALDQVADRVDGLESGADDYLVKPFDMDELLARITALGRRASAPTAPVLRAGDLEITTSRREVKRDGVLIPLRPKEYALLELLATRMGRVVTKREIFECCWDEAHDPLSNVEEVLVASLRRKLGEPAMIRTVRGSGYLLEGSGDVA